MLKKLSEARNTIRDMMRLVSDALMEERYVHFLRLVRPTMPESRARRIIATWRDKGAKPAHSILGLAHTGSYRQAVAVGKMSPEEFAEWRANYGA